MTTVEVHALCEQWRHRRYADRLVAIEQAHTERRAARKARHRRTRRWS